MHKEAQVRRLCLLLSAPSFAAHPPSFVASSPPARRRSPLCRILAARHPMQLSRHFRFEYISKTTHEPQDPRKNEDSVSRSNLSGPASPWRARRVTM